VVRGILSLLASVAPSVLCPVVLLIGTKRAFSAGELKPTSSWFLGLIEFITSVWLISAHLLRTRHDSGFDVGRQRLGVEGLSHYDEIAVDEIWHPGLFPCRFVRACAVNGCSLGFRRTRLHDKDASTVGLTESLGRLSRNCRFESRSRCGSNRSNRLRTVGRSWTHRRGASCPSACDWGGDHRRSGRLYHD
jgi:hypothetical protein